MSLSPAANAGIGVLLSLTASAVDAIGINLQRRDHIKNLSRPIEEQKPEWKRPTWWVGFLLYIGSQLFGSLGALLFLTPAVVACLGAAALIFNFLFAAWLARTVVHRIDVLGTFLIILGSVLVAIFGTLPEQEIDLEKLLHLYNRPVFIAYFTALIAIATIFLVITYALRRMVTDPVLKQKVKYVRNMRLARLRKFVGFGFAISGGMIASVTVQLAKTGVTLVTTSYQGNNQFDDSGTAWIILIILIASAVVQVICMNSGLKICDSVTVVPVFFAFYSTLSLCNQNVYYDLWNDYGVLNYGLLIPSIFILTYGVYIITASHAVDAIPDSALEEETDDEEWNVGQLTVDQSSKSNSPVQAQNDKLYSSSQVGKTGSSSDSSIDVVDDYNDNQLQMPQADNLRLHNSLDNINVANMDLRPPTPASTASSAAVTAFSRSSFHN